MKDQNLMVLALHAIYNAFFPDVFSSAKLGAASLVPFSCVPTKLCLYGEPDGLGNVVLTVHSSAAG